MRDAPSHCSDRYVHTIVLDLRHSLPQTLSSVLTTMLTFLIKVYKYLILPGALLKWSWILLMAAAGSPYTIAKLLPSLESQCNSLMMELKAAR